MKRREVKTKKTRQRNKTIRSQYRKKKWSEKKKDIHHHHKNEEKEEKEEEAGKGEKEDNAEAGIRREGDLN